MKFILVFERVSNWSGEKYLLLKAREENTFDPHVFYISVKSVKSILPSEFRYYISSHLTNKSNLHENSRKYTTVLLDKLNGLNKNGIFESTFRFTRFNFNVGSRYIIREEKFAGTVFIINFVDEFNREISRAPCLSLRVNNRSGKQLRVITWQISAQKALPLKFWR